MNSAKWALSLVFALISFRVLADIYVEKEQVEADELLLKGFRYHQHAELYWSFANGNSDYSNWALKHSGALKYFRHSFETGLDYKSHFLNGKKDSEVLNVGGKYIYFFDKNYGAFYGYNIRREPFSGIPKAQNHDLGPRFFFSLSEESYILSEIGYRYTLEESSDGVVKNRNKGRLYLEYSYFLKSGSQFKIWTELVKCFGENCRSDEDLTWSFEPSLSLYFSGDNYIRIAVLGYYRKPLSYPGEKYMTYYGETALGTKF